MNQTKHYNNLTPAEAERLALVAEEAGEVLQAVGKVLRHGYDNFNPKTGLTNREALSQEVGDLLAVIALAGERGDINASIVSKFKDEKLIKAKPYLRHN